MYKFVVLLLLSSWSRPDRCSMAWFWQRARAHEKEKISHCPRVFQKSQRYILKTLANRYVSYHERRWNTIFGISLNKNLIKYECMSYMYNILNFVCTSNMIRQESQNNVKHNRKTGFLAKDLYNSAKSSITNRPYGNAFLKTSTE